MVRCAIVLLLCASAARADLAADARSRPRSRAKPLREEVSLEVPARVALHCRAPFEESTGWRGGCAAVIPVAVSNETGARVVLERAWADGRSTVAGGLVTPAIALAPGERWRGELEVGREEHYQVTLAVTYSSTGMTHMNSPRAGVDVFNPARAAALAACRRCGGRFTEGGLAAIERCVCPFPDGGKRCRDGRECRGGCLFDHFEVVRKPDWVRPVGRCARDDDTFGCRTPIPDGAAGEPPRRARTLATSCAD